MYSELFRYLTGGDVSRGGADEGRLRQQERTDLDNECCKPGGEGILGWDSGGPKPKDIDNPPVEETRPVRQRLPLYVAAHGCAAVHRRLRAQHGVRRLQAGQRPECGDAGITTQGGLGLSLERFERSGRHDQDPRQYGHGGRFRSGWEYQGEAPPKASRN